VSSVAKYAYINAKVRGMMGRLLTKEAIDSLIGAESFQTMVRLLEQSPYGPRLAELPFEEINSRNLDRVFSEDFIEAFNVVYRSSPNEVREFLDRVRMKFEARTLKTLIRVKVANLPLEEAMRYVIPVGTLTMDLCEELLRKKDLKEMVDVIPIKIFKEAIKEKWRYYEETENIFPLEVAIDKTAFEEIWRYIEDNMKGVDKQVAERVVGTEIDTINIKIVLRGKFLGLDPLTIQRLLLKVNYRLRKEFLQKSLEAKSVNEVIETLAAYPYHMGGIVKSFQTILLEALRKYEKKELLTGIEVELDKLIYEVSKKAGFGNPFQIGTILCYLNLKWFEIKNLKTIVVGKEEKIIPIHIRKYLIQKE